MYGELSYAQSNASAIMDSLKASIADVRFGVASQADYPDYYSYCGYADTYGDPASGDFPYTLDRPLTYDTSVVRAVINSLYLRYGGDGPESYARLLWEMLNDPSIGWRNTCARFVLYWLDDIPHACDIYNPSRPYSAWTGTDPGRDGVAGTTDDIYWYPLLRDLRSNGIKPVILVSASYTAYLSYWQYWMSDTLANGIAVVRGSAIARQIDSLVGSTALTIDTLRPVVREPAYTSWVSFTPPYYTGITITPPEDTFNFTITFTVPLSAPPGLHTFHIDYYRDAILLDSQVVNLWVYDCIAGYDDPISVNEGIGKGSITLSGDKLYISTYADIYSSDGKKVITLRPGHYNLKAILPRGIYFVNVRGVKILKVIVK